MRTLLQCVSWVVLLGAIVPAILFLLGTITLDQCKWIHADHDHRLVRRHAAVDGPRSAAVAAYLAACSRKPSLRSSLQHR